MCTAERSTGVGALGHRQRRRRQRERWVDASENCEKPQGFELVVKGMYASMLISTSTSSTSLLSCFSPLACPPSL